MGKSVCAPYMPTTSGTSHPQDQKWSQLFPDVHVVDYQKLGVEDAAAERAQDKSDEQEARLEEDVQEGETPQQLEERLDHWYAKVNPGDGTEESELETYRRMRRLFVKDPDPDQQDRAVVAVKEMQEDLLRLLQRVSQLDRALTKAGLIHAESKVDAIRERTRKMVRRHSRSRVHSRFQVSVHQFVCLAYNVHALIAQGRMLGGRYLVSNALTPMFVQVERATSARQHAVSAVCGEQV